MVASCVDDGYQVSHHCDAQVVVTGSSRGLGYALADHFLQLGDDVVISSRREEACKEAAQRLSAKHPDRTVVPFACDVRNAGAAQSVRALCNERRCMRLAVWWTAQLVASAHRTGPAMLHLRL